MTTKTIYVAWDGEEFYYKKDCEEYEKKYHDAVKIFLHAYHFYDEEKYEQFVFSSDLDEIFDWIFRQYDNCVFIKVTEKIPPEILDRICSVDGLFFPVEVGLYHYEWGTSTGWVKED